MSESHQHDTRAPTVYHEAGHAVVAWYCGANIGNVSMEPDQDHGIGAIYPARRRRQRMG